MGEKRLGALAMRLAAVDAAAGRHAYGQRRDEFAGRTIAQTGGFGNDLVRRRVKIIRELDFDDGAQAVSPHADRRSHNTAL